MSVNLAARQVREPGFVDDVRQILSATAWPARFLQLELTESALMGTNTGSMTALRALADMGVRIAIDDFGTGYSNLAYLRQLPVHTLKLAGNFVTGGPDHTFESADGDLLAVLVQLAHVLGLTVTAESVETPAQFTRLRDSAATPGRAGCSHRPSPRTTSPDSSTHRHGPVPVAATLTGLLPLSEAQHRPPAPALQDVERPSDETTHVQVARPMNRASRTSAAGIANSHDAQFCDLE